MKDTITHAWLRRVSDYHSGGVSAAERAAVEAHLAECADCRQALVTYQRLYALARSPLRLGDGGNSALTGYRPVIQEEIMIGTDRDPHTGTTPTRQGPARAALTTLGAIAAVVLIAVLAAALFAQYRGSSRPPASHPHPTPAATLDAESQAYVTLLRTYYTPALVDTDVPLKDCFIAISNHRDLQKMLTCRPLWADQLALVQTLRAKLATANPPARWQTLHAALRQAIDGRIAVLTAQLAAIDAHDIAGFLNTQPTQVENFQSFCPIITQLNAGPPPSSPPFRVPEPLMCS